MKFRNYRIRLNWPAVIKFGTWATGILFIAGVSYATGLLLNLTPRPEFRGAAPQWLWFMTGGIAVITAALVGLLIVVGGLIVVADIMLEIEEVE